MPEERTGEWAGRLEAEIARELGQPVAIAAGGEAPEAAQSLSDTLEIPGARLRLAVDREDLAGILIEGRLIERPQADETTVRELWSGILASVAARLGGTQAPAPAGAPVPEGSCTLRLGGAAMRMALSVEPEAGRPRAGGERPAERRNEGPAPAAASSSAAAGNYDLLLEVELDASVRFGSREMELREVLELGPGDVVELDRQVSDPVDLVVGDKIVARGEVVLVNGNFGLRVTEVAEPVRRLESIRCLL